MRNAKTYEEIQAAEAQIWEEKAAIDYTSVEFPVETLVEKYLNDDFLLSEYSTASEWNRRQQSKFIEAILLNMPIPNLFFVKQDQPDKYEILEGIERVKTIVAFVTGSLKLENLLILNKLNGFGFGDLSPFWQKRLQRKYMRTTILQGDFPKENPRDLAERIYLMHEYAHSTDAK